MKRINLKSKIVMILLSLLIIPTAISIPIVSAYTANWGASSGGGFGGGVSGFMWHGNKQGARISVVDALSGEKAFGPSSTINVSSETLSANTKNYGVKTKLEYRSNPSMNKELTFKVYKSSTLPKMVGRGAAPVGALKKFAMTKQFHKDVLIKYIPALKAMGEEAALAELATGKYKIILEPFAVTQINGVEHAITATEAALIDLQNGGSLETHQPRGGLAKWAVTLSHDWLPRSAYLEKEEFGIKPFANEPALMGKYTVTQQNSSGKYVTRLGKRPVPLNKTILDRMGIAVLSISPTTTVVPPKTNLRIREFDGEYYKNGNYVEVKANAEIDKGFPWQITNDGGKNWSNAPMPGPTNHYFYLQWGSDWDNETGRGMGRDYLVEDTNVFNNGEIHHLVDPATGSKKVKIDLPEIPEGETFFVVRYAVNPTAKAPKFTTSLDPYGRKETTMQDNYGYLLFDLEKTDVDLIAKSIIPSGARPTVDYSKVCTYINTTTVAEGIKGSVEFLTKYPWSPVDVEIWVDGAKRDDLSKKYKHELKNKSHSKSIQLCLPNDYESKLEYNVKVKLTINKNKDNPQAEKTFDNNSIEIEFPIPTIPKPEPLTPPIIPDPDLILPFYNTEKIQCYLPHNPKTGQKAQILYDIGTYEHEHIPSWVGASNYDPPEPEDLAHLNTGRPNGYKEVVVFGPLCPQETDAYQQCLDFRDANQKATGFNWWDTKEFQKNNTKERKETENVIFQYRIEPIRVRDHDNVLHHGCCGHCEASDSEGRCTSWYTPPPHYHYHTEYQVKKIEKINMVNNIKTQPVANKTVDHATQKSVTRSGYGVYSTFGLKYDTDHTKTTNDCCKFDTEVYMFMPHLNKFDKPGVPAIKRIVPMDITNKSKKPFPTAARTARNPKSLQKLRQQFIDVDYPDGDYLINFRYKLRAPNFKPTQYPTVNQQGLKTDYPTALPALGACNNGTIKIEGNMWDDVWVHPDDPNGARR